MKKQLGITALGAAMALAMAPAHALEFVKGEARGMSALFGQLIPIPLPDPGARQNAEAAQARVINEREVKDRNEGKIALPRCVRAEGSLRIVEPDDGQSLWASYGLPMPTRMLRSFVSSSSCFTVLDRGVGFAAAQAERELAAGGHLQRSANIGGGQMLAADYILIPDIVSQNSNAGGRNVGLSGGGSAGGLGRLMGGFGGQSQRKTAAVMLTLVDSRTSEVLAAATGEAEISDKQWKLMASGAGSNGLASGQGSVSAGAYENTEIGTVIRAAYHYAFHQLLVNLEPMDLLARVSAAPQAVAQQQPAQVGSYGTGGMPTASTSGQPAQLALDQHAAHSQIHMQQMRPHAAMPLQAGAAGMPMDQAQQLQMQQLLLQQQLQQQQLQQQQQFQLQQGVQPVQGLQINGTPVALDAQGLTQQLVGQLLPAEGAQLAGQLAQGLQQGNLGQAVVQQVAGQMLPAGTAQLAGQLAQGLQQDNLGQAVVQQVAGQMLPAGTAQMAGQLAQGLQQGNLGQAVVQQVVQGAAQHFAGTPAAAMGVLVLKVPANFQADASGGGAVIRVLQPGETLARLGLSPQGTMIQVRDAQGVIGWIPAATHADLINSQG